MDQLDKYRLEERLGEGGMAHVWRAVDTSLDRPVVIKLMKLGLDSADRERFLGEAQALTRLRSRHILEVLDFGESENSVYFVMPFVQVACLADLMESRAREGNRFDPAETATLGLQLAEALAEAHRHEILHRDVKPQNILVTPSGSAYLTDFGIARDLRRQTPLTEAGTVLGTPRYMAPEQIQGKSLGFSTDLYSLGLILFELLAGRLPREAGNDLPATLRSRLAGDYEDIGAIVPEAAGWPAILKRLLAAPGSELRYQSASELLESLKKLVPSSDALTRLGTDVRKLLENRGAVVSPVEPTSPWTLLGQRVQASSTLSPRELQAAPAKAQFPVPPQVPAPAPKTALTLARPAAATPQLTAPARSDSPASRVIRAVLAPLRRHRHAVALGIVILGLLGTWAAQNRPARQTPIVDMLRVTAGFRKMKLEWRGEAKELSLVTPRGHEGLYDVRGRHEWESSSLNEPGVYVASLVPPVGDPVQVPPIDYAPLDATSLPIRLERNFNSLRLTLSLPVEAQIEVLARGEGLSEERVSSPGAARQHSLRLRTDPMQGCSLKIVLKSRLGEETLGPKLDLPPLTTAFRAAAEASKELCSKVNWKAWCSRLLKKHYHGETLAPEALREIAALGLDAPYSALYAAVPGFLDSSRVPIEEKSRLYRSLARLQDLDFLCERYGLPAVSAAGASLPPTWRCTSAAGLTGTEELQLPFTGIMSFQPKPPERVASYDVFDEVSRVEYKETQLSLKDVRGIHQVELVLETWALKPDQWFSVSVNGLTDLEFRPRGKESRERIFKKETLALYHPVDPACLKEGTNTFRVSIHYFPPGDTPESAALNGASLLLVRGGPR